MQPDNRTLLIAGVILIGLAATYLGYNELATASVAGLVGYLAKDIDDDNKHSSEEYENNTEKE